MAAKACYINNRPKDPLSWVLDTGATQHFTNDKTDLYGYKRFREPKQVFLGDDSFVYAEGQGILRLQVGPYSLNLLVWFVPKLAENLISSHLLDSSGYDLYISAGIVYIWRRGEPESAYQRLAEALNESLYRVRVNRSTHLNELRALRTREYSTLRAWHNRLGHRDF
jgi:hypothetical protein